MRDAPRVNTAPSTAGGRPDDRSLPVIGRLVVLGFVALGLPVAAGDPTGWLSYVSYGVVGFVLVVRRPRNSIGWLLFAIAYAFAFTTTDGVDGSGLITGTAGPIDVLRIWLSVSAGLAGFVCYYALAIVFPSGHLPTGRWRRPAMALLVLGCVFAVSPALAPTLPVDIESVPAGAVITNPFAILPAAPIWTLPGLPELVTAGCLALVVIGAASLVVRYRRSTGVLRLQLRWLVASLAFVVIGLAIGIVVTETIGGGTGWLVALVAFPTVPLAIGVAVLRYHLLEIDRIISRTISYASVTLLLFALFGLVNLTVQFILGPFVRGNTIAVAVSTLVVAAAFNPVRLRLQRLIDRQFNRARFNHERLVAGFASGIRDDVEIEHVLDHLQATVQEAVEPRVVGVWRRTRPTAT